MPDRADSFLAAMAAIGVVGVLAFAVYLIGRFVRRPQQAAVGRVAGAAVERPQWFEFLLALLLLAVVTAVAAWQLLGGQMQAADGWRGDDRALAFFVIMLAAAGLGLIAFLVYLGLQSAERRRLERRLAGSAAADETVAEAPPVEPVPSGVRLLGLLLFVVGFLLLNWIYVPGPLQQALMLYLFYPVSVAVTLVLLFDKATRAWSTKGGAESFREWLFCDVVALLLVLGFLNLQQTAAESYAALFWDVLFIALSLLAFWLVDRQQAAPRFLIGYGYFILLPILLLIWRTIQEVATPEGLSWWSTIWPFFLLAILFFLLELATLMAPSGSERHGLAALKDIIFYVVYAILLIVALPAAAA